MIRKIQVLQDASLRYLLAAIIRNSGKKRGHYPIFSLLRILVLFTHGKLNLALADS